MGIALTNADGGLHPAGSEPHGSESRYLDFCDAAQGLAGQPMEALPREAGTGPEPQPSV